ncbi:hypothetical protein IAI10_20895 [Clostridium sp. 19966]|uniref:hypothetical protein n=1 Tax=Clostridium sp. 19966 TaxID=2768166 RepID=UPI0028DEAC07|nr:hypothetical protein [Clostridium sp. 19966]MDT8719111.1 hypothetical protein [Clostridium sp. 19966]
MEEKKTFKENTANMNKKEKLKYIWYYYKFHIIVTIVIVAMVGSFVSTLVTRKSTYASITLLGDYVDNSKLSDYNKKANASLLPNNKKSEITITFLQKGDDSNSYNADQALTARIAAKDIDILVLSKSDFNNYAKLGSLLDLSDLKNDKDLSKLNFIEATNDSDKGKITKPYGIDANDFSSSFNSINYDYKDKVVAIIVNTTNKDNSVKFLKWMLK